ncbi:MAG: hypothetical protein AVDCRST_MAG11-2296 [uncultured Gemmatimonadaceae bacterium]|uniref:Uncharacterized protein n=1 Tax=uncultured Gemmatimonadaceae bacterium TaxID=246130 RepID=A0A6J4LDA5_9BACT|nr:MAG: hypothetical protein AVDCRST_MAG11-2296 [uncultured Gemmatimonadaceae bacterium]
MWSKPNSSATRGSKVAVSVTRSQVQVPRFATSVASR